MSSFEPGGLRRSSSAPPLSASERLRDAVVGVAAEHPADCCTVDRICERAGVARSTFYQYFTEAEDCLSHAYRSHVEELQARVTAALGQARIPELAAVLALAEFAAEAPEPARFLAIHGLSEGQVLVERDRMLGAIAKAVQARGAAPVYLDLPLLTLFGGALRFIALHTITGDDGVEAGEALADWALRFERRRSQPSWSATVAAEMPVADWPPRQLARPRGSTRGRILQATAAVVCTRGYRDATVTDIVRHAHVSRRSFYNCFASKEDCYAAAFADGFQRSLAACAPAFFSPGSWPERVWRTAGAFASFFAREPFVAHLCFVDSHAAGPALRARLHEAQQAFAIFLEEGYRLHTEATPERVCSAVTAQVIAEFCFTAIRHGGPPAITRGRPLAAYLALAPFMGCDPAGEFLAAQLGVARTP